MRIWIVTYIKYKHPGSIWFIPSSFHMQEEGWHLPHQHTSEHQSKFMYLKAGGFSTYKTRTPCVFLALMMMSPFLHTKPTLAGVSAAKWKRISKTTEVHGLLLQRRGNMVVAPQERWWVCCGSQVMQFKAGGDRAAGRRVEASAPSLPCVSSSWCFRGVPWRAQSGCKHTLVCGSRSRFWEGKRKPQC